MWYSPIIAVNISKCKPWMETSWNWWKFGGWRGVGGKSPRKWSIFASQSQNFRRESLSWKCPSSEISWLLSKNSVSNFKKTILKFSFLMPSYIRLLHVLKNFGKRKLCFRLLDDLRDFCLSQTRPVPASQIWPPCLAWLDQTVFYITSIAASWSGWRPLIFERDSIEISYSKSMGSFSPGF